MSYRSKRNTNFVMHVVVLDSATHAKTSQLKLKLDLRIFPNYKGSPYLG